jgi:hypothetical protein
MRSRLRKRNAFARTPAHPGAPDLSLFVTRFRVVTNETQRGTDVITPKTWRPPGSTAGGADFPHGLGPCNLGRQTFRTQAAAAGLEQLFGQARHRAAPALRGLRVHRAIEGTAAARAARALRRCGGGRQTHDATPDSLQRYDKKHDATSGRRLDAPVRAFDASVRAFDAPVRAFPPLRAL